jgi:hypothetical protein
LLRSYTSLQEFVINIITLKHKIVVDTFSIAVATNRLSKRALLDIGRCLSKEGWIIELRFVCNVASANFVVGEPYGVLKSLAGDKDGDSLTQSDRAVGEWCEVFMLSKILNKVNVLVP